MHEQEVKLLRKKYQGKYYKLHERYWFRITHIDNVWSAEHFNFFGEGYDSFNKDYYDGDTEWEITPWNLDCIIKISKSEFVRKIQDAQNKIGSQ